MDRISLLILKKITSSLSTDEAMELETWIGNNPARRNLVDRLTDPSALDEEYAGELRIRHERPARDMALRIQHMHRQHTRRRVLRAAAAIAATTVIGAAAWLYITGGSDSSDNATPPLAGAILSIDDIAPGKTGAVYKTANGDAVALGASDTAIMANRLPIRHPDRCDANRPADNLCLEVARGHEFKIMLEDSTVVWLNSESTLSYPEVFSASERRVHVTGEAYFAVKPDASRPFYVETDVQVVRVYGTAFNVRTYADDPCVCTTLEHGSIAISLAETPSGEVRLSPGHQARLNRQDSKLDMLVVDPQVITGWRNGRFVFQNQPLSVIMRDLARWYDFEYEFDDPDLQDIIFMGSIPRYSDFSVAKRILERSGGIELKASGSKIIITTCSK